MSADLVHDAVLEVRGRPLTEPDVAPPAGSDEVAEPLVRQLVGDSRPDVEDT